MGFFSTDIHGLTAALQAKSKSAKITSALNTIRSQGFPYYAHNYFNKFLKKTFMIQKQRLKINDNTWKTINFEALNLHGTAKIRLNPQDTGFSKEFSVYGFREPLNSFALFCHVAKKKPVVLDIGGNLGYFSLIELQAGAKQVIAVEPVPSTFNLLAKNLENYKEAEVLNIAISDTQGTLKLYVSTNHNVTYSSRQLLADTGNKLAYAIDVRAETLQSMAQKYPISMVRMDVEGHEYQILAQEVPAQIDSISIELHVLPPYDKKQAVKLLRHLSSQNFNAKIAINEMNYPYYPLIQKIGLKSAYKMATAFGKQTIIRPCIQVNPSFNDLVDRIPERGNIHLLLER